VQLKAKRKRIAFSTLETTMMMIHYFGAIVEVFFAAVFENIKLYLLN
jgi:hypothetical protein